MSRGARRHEEEGGKSIITKGKGSAERGWNTGRVREREKKERRGEDTEYSAATDSVHVHIFRPCPED